jgi:hypothetical protein
MDIELRGTGFTPLALSLTQVNEDLDALRAIDPQAECRPYRVVLVTDGRETCLGSPTNAAAALHADGADVYVIGFSGNPDFFEDEMNAIAASGGTGQAYFVDDPVKLSAALADIVAKTVLVEICDNEDNDCDGIVDNGFQKGTCNNGQRGACFRAGEYVCVSETETECNAPHIEPPTRSRPAATASTTTATASSTTA